MAPRLIRSFAETLGLLDRGAFVSKCNNALTEAIENLEGQPSEKGKATITVTLDLTYDKGMLQVLPSLKSKLPEAERSAATIFWAHEGALSTQHPSQIDLEESIRDSMAKSSILAAG
jgi:hypothetical protein